MCNNVSLKTKQLDIFENQVGLRMRPDQREMYRQYYEVSGFTKPFLPIQSIESREQLEMGRWRLVPGWAKQEETFKANTLNARSEGIFESGTYRNYWKNRCLLLCTGFFEPHAVPGRKTKESWYIGPKQGEIIKLGCIYSYYQGVKTFSIVTAPASPLMEFVHNEAKRMPLVLSDDKAEAWLLQDLKKEEMQDLMRTPEVDDMIEAYRVIDGVTNTRLDTNVPEVLERVE